MLSFLSLLCSWVSLSLSEFLLTLISSKANSEGNLEELRARDRDPLLSASSAPLRRLEGNCLHLVLEGHCLKIHNYLHQNREITKAKANFEGILHQKEIQRGNPRRCPSAF